MKNTTGNGGTEMIETIVARHAAKFAAMGTSHGQIGIGGSGPYLDTILQDREAMNLPVETRRIVNRQLDEIYESARLAARLAR